MLHDSHAADAEGQDANEYQQDLQSDGDAVDHWAKFFASEHLDGFLSVGENCWRFATAANTWAIARCSNCGATGSNTITAACLVFQRSAGRGVRDPGGFVVAGKIVAELNLAAHGADYRETDSADDYGLAYRRDVRQITVRARVRQENTTRRRSSSSSELIQRPSEGSSLRISPYSGQTPRTAAVPTMRFP